MNNGMHLVTGQKFSSLFISPEVWVLDLLLQADRSKRRMVLHWTSRLVLETRLKALAGTDVMPVLSHMILDKEAEDSAFLCLAVKTPGFSYQSLKIQCRRRNEMISVSFYNIET